jgi:uncharacterized protein YndB with AHSA1/START domain
MAQWFGPKGVKIIHSDHDLRSGGGYHYGMQTPDGSEMWGKWVYREIVEPERLVFVNSFSDEKGGLARQPHAAECPLEMLLTITFAENGGRTTVTIHWVPINAIESERKTFAAAHEGMQNGWTGTLDQLAEYLRST